MKSLARTILPQVKHTVNTNVTFLAAAGYVKTNSCRIAKVMEVKVEKYVTDNLVHALDDFFYVRFLDNNERMRVRANANLCRAYVKRRHLVLYRIKMFFRKAIRVSIRFAEQRQGVQ